VLVGCDKNFCTDSDEPAQRRQQRTAARPTDRNRRPPRARCSLGYFLSRPLYIFGVEPFKGGYVGVDIFSLFMSGYLIAGIIFSELGRGSFSLARFYERRARRILPALLLVIAVRSKESD